MELPARIGKYELEEFLGGGMSHVYRARDTVIGRTVAVKILTEQGCQDPEAKARFLAEARMAGNITHDNVLSIYDFGEDEQHRPFMVMEMLKGEDLRHAIKGGHTGDLKSKLKIALQVGRALGYIHTQKIIHRDIKPENIHINAAGVVKLMDFGIAKTEGLNMTRAGYVLGTPYYMAPEQVMGQDVTDQVDVYSFGILLFELMTGGKPITGDSVERIFYSILNEPLNLEPMRQAGVSQPICDLVARCTAKSQAERPQGFTPVCADIERAIADLDAPTMVLPAPVHLVKAERPGWVLPVVLLLVVALAVGLYFAMGRKTTVIVDKKGIDLPKKPELPKSITSWAILKGEAGAKTDIGEMVLVPEGPFKFGRDKEERTLPAFYIDKTEVTNEVYAAFCTLTQRDLPPHFPQDKPNYPVVYVSMEDAMAFAKWASKRIPTEQEWEKAARGPDGRLYPWGDENDPSRANVNAKETRPVTDFAEFPSPVGTFNMVGNVFEMVNQASVASPQSLANYRAIMKQEPTESTRWYTMRGSAFSTPKLTDDVLWDSTPMASVWKTRDIGFRCVKDPPKEAGQK